MRNFLGSKPVGKFIHDYATTNVLTSAWIELITSVAQPASAVEIFDSSGRILKLAKAASGQEDDNELKYYIIPGGSSIFLPLEFSKGSRIAIRAVDDDATVGSLVINFFG